MKYSYLFHCLYSIIFKLLQVLEDLLPLPAMHLLLEWLPGDLHLNRSLVAVLHQHLGEQHSLRPTSHHSEGKSFLYSSFTDLLRFFLSSF